MKTLKQILLVLCCIFFTVSALATSVTQNNAAMVAKNYFSEVLLSHGKNFTTVISESFEITKEGNPVLYVFNFEKGGYVIVSAEDRFTPIVGYSPDGYYDPNNMPDGFKFLMEEFSEMITLIREKNIEGEPQHAAKWKRYQSDSYTAERGAAAVVVALSTALWYQDYPYNYYCPVVAGSTYGGKAPTGCVATALGIMLYYWRWPWIGTGSRTYTPGDCNGVQMPVLSANFGETFYDYNGMYGTSTINADKFLYEPISLLLYHAGISVNMQYCLSSGAYSKDVPNAMRNYFKYISNIQEVKRASYTTAAWTALMKEQLDLKQPVYLSAHSPTVGHALVCDGYDSNDLLHYNFGWSGSFNGFFAADAPYTSYNLTTTSAVINFVPDRAQGYPIDCNGSWTLPYMKGMLADCSGPVDNYLAGTTASWLIDPATGGHYVGNITLKSIEMDLASGDYLRIYDGENESAPLLGEFTENDPIDITSTENKVLVKFTSATSSATAQGFMISYEAELLQCCDPRKPITLTAISGKFTDGCPEDLNYNNNLGPCIWNIFPEDAIPETEILIKFNRLDTEEGKDVIKFIDQNTLKLITSFSGNYGPGDELPQFIAKTTKVRVMFSSNAEVTGKGFEIEYFASPMSIIELENINSLFIYPNPVKEKLFVKFNAAVADDYNIAIYNVTGQTIHQETLHNFVGEYDNTLNLSNLAQAVYLLQIKSSKGMITRKIVK